MIGIYQGKKYDVPEEQEFLILAVNRIPCRIVVFYPLLSDGRFQLERPDIPQVRMERMECGRWVPADGLDVSLIAVEALRRLAMDSPTIRKPEMVSEFAEVANGRTE